MTTRTKQDWSALGILIGVLSTAVAVWLARMQIGINCVVGMPGSHNGCQPDLSTPDYYRPMVACFVVGGVGLACGLLVVAWAYLTRAKGERLRPPTLVMLGGLAVAAIAFGVGMIVVFASDDPPLGLPFAAMMAGGTIAVVGAIGVLVGRFTGRAASAEAP